MKKRKWPGVQIIHRFSRLQDHTTHVFSIARDLESGCSSSWNVFLQGRWPWASYWTILDLIFHMYCYTSYRIKWNNACMWLARCKLPIYVGGEVGMLLQLQRKLQIAVRNHPCPGHWQDWVILQIQKWRRRYALEAPDKRGIFNRISLVVLHFVWNNHAS